MSDGEKITPDDCVVLGQAVPDEISDTRFTVCTAVYSPRYGLLRIYPLPPNAKFKRWNVMELPLERNPKDTRSESWKVQGSKAEWDTLPSKLRTVDSLKTKADKLKLLDKLHAEYGVGCVEDLNERKVSLGFVKPEILGYGFVERESYDPSVQTTLFSSTMFKTIQNYPLQPRIKYRCSDCKSKNPHNQQVIEWGFYEWMRNNPKKEEQVWENLGIGQEGWEIKSFLVGNQFLYRSSFMIISVFRFKVT